MTDLTVDVSLLGDALTGVAAIAPVTTWEQWLSTWLTHLAPALSPLNAYELSLQFTTDAAIADLNHQYRQQNRPTDVISFAALDEDPLPAEVWQTVPFYLGDIIISVETAQRQCTAHSHTLREELAWLTAHGLLHLLGWDHPDEAHLQAMLATQRTLLEAVGFNLAGSDYFGEEYVETLA